MVPLAEDEFAALFDHWAHGEPVAVRFDRATAWAVLSQLQLAARHPRNKGATAQRAKEFGRLLQRWMKLPPELAGIAEMGWDERFDQ